MQLHDVLFGIYLVVGCLVMTNLLLLSGLKRRREIALRRVEGATRADIFRQFLWEGVLLGVLGLVLGVVAGILLGKLRVWLDPNVVLAVAVPWKETTRISLFLLAGALIASSYPAWRASKHHPMTILRRGR